MTVEPRGHVFPKWGPRGPFRVYSWVQASVTAAGLVVAAFMLVAGLGAPAVVLVIALGGMGLRDSTGMPVWHRVGLGLRYLATRWSGRSKWVGEEAASLPRWLAGFEYSALERRRT